MPEDITDVNGNPAIETDEPMSIQEANVWAVEQRDKADPRKAAIERLKCLAAKRRERKPANPLETLKLDPSYKVGEFNPEADAFNVESNDGKKLLGKSLSNGNVQNGQKVRSFFDSNGRVVIDVKPKGRDIVIPKPLTKAPVDEEIWPCTVGFLHCEINSYTEDLTDNGLATGDETSWDWNKFNAWSSSNQASTAYVFGQQFNTLGDYATGADALANILKPDRLIVPSGGSGGEKDDGAIASGSADAITIWFYVGDPTDALSDGRICSVSGTPLHPSAGNITTGGPGFCMEVYRGGMGSCIFPQESMGQGPLTTYLKQSFPSLGGRIGYAGRIARWRGMQDYTTASYLSYFRNTPSVNQPNQTPTSTPSWYTPNPNVNPWMYTGATWYHFGWPDPQYIGCASSSWINIEVSALNSMTGCGGSIAPDKWYWGGDATPNYGRLDRDNPSGYIGVKGVFVCWQGHKDNAGLAQSFFEAFKTYWGIDGSVTKLGSCNRYGCEIPNGGGYPPAPPTAPAQRYLARYFGRKAKIYLTIHKGDKLPLKLQLPIEFAACTERVEVLGGGSFGRGTTDFEAYKSISLIRTYSQMFYYEDPFALELVHGTLSIDGEFAYIDIFCGGERIRETPQTKPVRTRLANLGFGPAQEAHERRMGTCNTEPIVGGYESTSNPVREPRVVKDCFGACHSFLVKLPTDKEESLIIVAYQKYKRGETIALTAAGQDNEFNNKFLIYDFRTNVEVSKEGVNSLYWTPPNTEFAGFGGLPTLIQTPRYVPDNINNFIPTFYKPQSTWTQMDRIHWHLQEGPKQFNPLNTVLPQGVRIAIQTTAGVFFEFDKKFGRHARAECIIPSASFGYNNTWTGGSAPKYGNYAMQISSNFLLFTSFSEQLRGNGVKQNGKIVKWFRPTASSFPVHGQLTRNG